MAPKVSQSEWTLMLKGKCKARFLKRNSYIYGVLKLKAVHNEGHNCL